MLADVTMLTINLIELGGAILILGYCAAAIISLARTRDPALVRLLVIEGSLWGLNLKTAASLLKTFEIQTWTQIGAFTAILTLRTMLRRVMSWEQVRLREQS